MTDARKGRKIERREGAVHVKHRNLAARIDPGEFLPFCSVRRLIDKLSVAA
jgi:hypothetical protein